MNRAIGLASGLMLLTLGLGGPPKVEAFRAQDAPADRQAAPRAGSVRYRVNYRATGQDPWQVYSETKNRTKAESVAAEVRASGYQAEVVNDLTPSPQPYPDPAETSASGYYPTSNWAADYNTYVVPGGNYNYGWYGGYNPLYGHRHYSNYWWNGGNSGYGGGWGGHWWNRGWHHGEGWGAHRHWNNSHAHRGSHFAHHERHGQHAHHMYHPHRNTAGHHTAGHHAAARHASNHSAEHRGTGHRNAGARTAGHRAAGHHAAGHAARGHAGRGGRGGGGAHNTAGRHAGGQHARHLDP